MPFRTNKSCKRGPNGSEEVVLIMLLNTTLGGSDMLNKTSGKILLCKSTREASRTYGFNYPQVHKPV